MPATQITTVLVPPNRLSPGDFADVSDAFVTALATTWTTEANALATAVNADAVTATTQAGLATTNGAEQVVLATEQAGIATTQATNAANSATAANSSALASGASLWVSGTTYAIGDCRWSPVTYQTFRRKTNGAGTTDPSVDSANWEVAIKVTITNVVAATTATTLTNTRTLLQITPASYGVAVTLPDATICALGGPLHIIDNRSSFAILLKNAGGIIIDCIGGKSTAYISVLDVSTSNGVWSTGTSAGMVLISEATASASAYLSFSLPTVFDEYRISLSALTPSATNISLYLYGSIDDGSTWLSTGYYYAHAGFASTVMDGESANNQAQILLNHSSYRPYGNLSGEVILHDVGTKRYPTVFANLGFDMGAATNVVVSTSAKMDVGVGNTVNAIKLAFNGQNITSGIVRVYGVKK